MIGDKNELKLCHIIGVCFLYPALHFLNYYIIHINHSTGMESKFCTLQTEYIINIKKINIHINLLAKTDSLIKIEARIAT